MERLFNHSPLVETFVTCSQYTNLLKISKLNQNLNQRLSPYLAAKYNQDLRVLAQRFGYSFMELLALKHLDLTSTIISQIPPEIAILDNLEEFTISSELAVVTEFPIEFFEMINLTSLHLYDAKYSLDNPIWEQFARLSNLDELSINSNNLSQFPAPLYKLKKLKYLDLNHNQLTEISETLCNFENLINLDLSLNQISRLPTEIAKLSNLTDLNLSDNRIIELIPELFKLKNLQVLDLRHNCFASVPAEISQLTNLIYLNLSGCGLTSLSSEIGKLSKLLDLYICDNKLIEIPGEIGNLEKLWYYARDKVNENLEIEARIRARLPDCLIYEYYFE